MMVVLKLFQCLIVPQLVKLSNVLTFFLQTKDASVMYHENNIVMSKQTMEVLAPNYGSIN